MDLQDLISRLALALGIGLLIGLERGWRRREGSPGSRAAVSAPWLSSLLGGVIAALAQASGGARTMAGGIILGLGFAVHAGDAAAAGALASSTAVTITNARYAAAREGSPRLFAAGVAVASAIMFLRVGAIVMALRPSMLVLVAPALLAATVAALGFAGAWMARQAASAHEHRGVAFRNPFDFWSVMGFALFLGVIMVLSRAVGETFGSTGAVLGAIVVGAADVDAITVSMARLTPETLSPAHATLAILAAAASSTVSKVAIGAAIGRGWFALDLAVLALGCLLVGAAAAWLTLAYVT